MQQLDNEKTTVNSTIEERKEHLEMLKKNLPAKLLRDFNEASINKIWTGNIEKKLFEYWLDLKKEFPGIII